MNQKLIKLSSGLLLVVVLSGMGACTFLQGSNLNVLAKSNIPVTPTPPSIYCDIICRMSLDSNAVEGNDSSAVPSGRIAVSADGRYVIFQSGASNLVTGDNNSVGDAFMRDNQTGITTLISSSSAGLIGDNNSDPSTISSDGRYGVFASTATNLVAGDTNSSTDIFLKDRQTGVTTLVSSDSSGVIGNANSERALVTPDAHYVVFISGSSNLVAGATTGGVFMKNTQTGTITLVSSDSLGVPGNGFSYDIAVSSDGRYVAFTSSSTNLVTSDINGTVTDIFLKDTQTGTTTLISSDSLGLQQNNYAYSPSMSSDGRYVVFQSSADNLVAGDTNGVEDVFLKDTQTGITTRISTDSSGVQGNAYSVTPVISGNGRYVVFGSAASNFDTADTNATDDVYLKDLQTGVTTLVSTSETGVLGNAESYDPSITPDGQYVVFTSAANNLVPGDTNGVEDVFLKRVIR